MRKDHGSHKRSANSLCEYIFWEVTFGGGNDQIHFCAFTSRINMISDLYYELYTTDFKCSNGQEYEII